jgi:hypothetical protein
MYSTQVNDMWQELQEAIENSSADHKQTNTMINLLDRLANYADDLEFENTGFKLERWKARKYSPIKARPRS